MTLMWFLVAFDVNEVALEHVAFKCAPTHYSTSVANVVGVTHGVNCEVFNSIACP